MAVRKKNSARQLSLPLTQSQALTLYRAPSLVRGYSTGALLKMGTQLARSLKQGARVPSNPGRKKRQMPARIGQFKKGGGRVSNGRRSSSKAITYRRGPAPIVKVVRVGGGAISKKKRGGGGRSSGGGRSLMRREHGSGQFVPGPFRMRSAAIAGAIGYAEKEHGLLFINDLLAKIPDIAGVPKEALAGAILNYFADRGDWFDASAQAFLDVGAYKFGQSKFEFTKSSGEDD